MAGERNIDRTSSYSQNDGIVVAGEYVNDYHNTVTIDYDPGILSSYISH